MKNEKKIEIKAIFREGIKIDGAFNIIISLRAGVWYIRYIEEKK